MQLTRKARGSFKIPILYCFGSQMKKYITIFHLEQPKFSPQIDEIRRKSVVKEKRLLEFSIHFQCYK
jgi:hypothetical protein